jgi:hypothetical protein
MMSDPNVPQPPLTPAELEAPLIHVETCCNRAAGIVNAAARAVAGDRSPADARLSHRCATTR